MKKIVENQRAFFKSGRTRTYAFRKKQLLKLKKNLQSHEDDVYKALKYDLNKSKQEAFTTELGLIYTEINFVLKHLKDWMKAVKVPTPLTHVGTKSYIHQQPYGVSLIISPWNYPLQLALVPLIGAIAAGNCAVLKPSEYAQSTSKLLAAMIKKSFDSAYITVVEGAKETSTALLQQRFDYIFFTGSSFVGKIVMESASKHLTPVTLELGGKSPVIVHQDANIKLAAKRIVWGKFTNAGQTCVAPDFVYVHKKVQERLIKAMKKYIRSFYGKNPLRNKNYVHIIHSDHFQRLQNYLSNGRIRYGGNLDENKLIIEPTLLDQISWDDQVMQEEIFGPLLPILPFDSLDDVIEQLKQLDEPLALYYFGKKKASQDKVIESISFGGGCINDTLYHLANPHLPFGGVGNSGIGHYHGRHSFDTFSHQKSILRQTNLFDLPFRYPGGRTSFYIVKKLMK